MKRWLNWLPPILWAGLIYFLSDQPRDFYPELFWGQVWSVVAHFGVYAVLMVLWAKALIVGTGWPPARAWLVAFVICSLYGISDEYHQRFVPGRVSDVFDWLTDTLGAGVAWWWLARRERLAASTVQNS